MGWWTWVLGAGLVVVVVLSMWATPGDGRRWLRAWGVPEATQQQAELVAVHLGRRRLSYPVLVVGSLLLTPPLLGALGQRPTGSRFVDLAVVVVGALLVGEVVDGLLERRGTVRVADLLVRRSADLVPGWATWVLRATAAYGVVVALLAGGLALAWRADPVTDPGAGVTIGEDGLRDVADLGLPGGVVVGLLLGVGAVELVVRTAVRRPPLPDPVVDRLLRARTARMATGAGLALAAGLAATAAFRVYSVLGEPFRGVDGSWAGPVGWAAGWSQLVLVLVGLGGWIAVTGPSRRERAGAGV